MFLVLYIFLRQYVYILYLSLFLIFIQRSFNAVYDIIWFSRKLILMTADAFLRYSCVTHASKHMTGACVLTHDFTCAIFATPIIIVIFDETCEGIRPKSAINQNTANCRVSILYNPGMWLLPLDEELPSSQERKPKRRRFIKNNQTMHQKLKWSYPIIQSTSIWKFETF